MNIENNNDGTVTITCTQTEYHRLCEVWNNIDIYKFYEEKYKQYEKELFNRKPLGNLKEQFRKTSDFNGTYITKVIYQNPATIVFWSDGTKTVSKCDENDTYDEEKGLILCIMKKVFPNKNIGTLLGMWTSGSAETYGKNTITLKQARKMEKEFSVYWNAITGKKGK